MNKNDDIEMTPEVRASLISENRKQFETVSKEAVGEFDGFRPCEKCGFLGRDCWKTCGVRMKHLWKAGKVTRA